MCGIAGFWGFRNDPLIQTISQELQHRGPDDSGFYIDSEVTLLNRRLAIIDLKTGNQPIYSEDRSIVTVYNGEIYNYLVLRKELEKEGHSFKTNSDTEVIIHGYEKWGDKCFDKFNGMFAIALYDKKKKRLVLARDHFGIKPLYYAFLRRKSVDESSPSLIFASEIKPIINSGLVEKKPNDRMIYRYLKYRIHDDQKETFFEGIYRLMPGQLLIIQNSKFKMQSFTTLYKELSGLSSQKKSQEKKDTTLDFKKKLIDAIRLRLISDVPVGTCLSGGLDSSTVVAVVNTLLKQQIKEAKSIGKIQKTFSAVFPGFSNDEEHYIDELIKKLDLKAYKVFPKPKAFFEDIEDFIKTQEEPTISTGPYSQYKVMQLASKYVKVVLDGQGSDEMFAGYDPYFFVYLRQLLKNKKIIEFLKEVAFSIDIIGKYLFQKKDITAERLLNVKFLEKYNSEKFSSTNNDLKKRLLEDIFFNSLPSLLRYEDKNSMRFSIEGRVPFLDPGFVKLIFGLPDNEIIKDGWNKFILRRSVKDLLPQSIVNRRNKIGFTTPEREWFMRMKNRIYSIFLSESFGKRPYFNQKEMLLAFQKFLYGKTKDTMPFWRFLNLELWLQVFFDKRDYNNKNKATQKKPEIKAQGKTYYRYPVKTQLFRKGDEYVTKISTNVFRYIDTSKLNDKLKNKKWFVVIAEKIIAISQGRSYFISDIKTGLWANFLSKFVKRTPYGIGLGSPWTMQLAIQEAGLLKILLATIASAVTKPLGIKGLFYHIAGRDVAAIDGPTEYSLYPSNVSAKLGPRQPNKVAKEIHQKIQNSKLKTQNFLGIVVIDANDLGQNVLGNSTFLKNSLIEGIFRDNPLGQSDEQTPLALVFQK